MCYGSRLAHGRGSERPPFAYATRHPDAAGLRVLQVVRALAVAQPADCRVAAERVVNIAKLVSVPQRPALQHHDAMHRTRRFCRRWKSKLRVTGVNEVKRTTCFGLSAIVPLTY